MPNLKEIQTRISSVKTTRQVTSAMKMVSASKLKRAHDNITRMRPYAEKLQTILSSLSQSVSGNQSPYTNQRSPERVLIVLITSNKGLCGGFNSNISKRAIEYAKTEFSQQYSENNVDFFVIGRQGAKLFKSRKISVQKYNDEIYDELSFENASAIATSLMSDFCSLVYDRIDFVYNKFQNAAVQIPTCEQFLPIKENDEGREDKLNSDFIFEPSKEEIVKNLIPQSLRTQFFKVLLDSTASEHGARMTAMTQATDNASELINDLTLTYNKARQASITNQIIEVTGGAEALN